MNIQKLAKTNADPYAVAHKYFQIISVLNDLELAHGEIQLVAFAAVRGNIHDPDHREDYCKKYDTTLATINNIVWRLKKKFVIIKQKKSLIVNPQLTLIKFNEPLDLRISLEIEASKKPTLEKEGNE